MLHWSVCEWLVDKLHPPFPKKTITGKKNNTIKTSTINQARCCSQACLKVNCIHAWRMSPQWPGIYVIFEDGLLWLFSMLFFASSQIVYGFHYLYLHVWVDIMSLLKSVWVCFPRFLFNALYCCTGCIFYRWRGYVCILIAPKQFSSDSVLSSRYIFLSATVMGASAQDWLFGLAIFCGSFQTFGHVRVPCEDCEVLDLPDNLRVCLDRLVTKVVNIQCPEINISCDAGYMWSNMH